jgi:hypothetical protein
MRAGRKGAPETRERMRGGRLPATKRVCSETTCSKGWRDGEIGRVTDKRKHYGSEKKG